MYRYSISTVRLETCFHPPVVISEGMGRCPIRGTEATPQINCGSGVLMFVAMMQIAIVRVLVRKPSVLVQMAVWLAREVAWCMRVLVMRVVEMAVLVFQLFAILMCDSAAFSPSASFFASSL
jgi:hypothetical protein